MQLQFKIKYKCSMLVGRRYKLVTGMGKRLIWNFNFKMCADFEPSNEGKTNLCIVERLCVKNNTVFPL